MTGSDSTLYFGYGSNLDADDWNIWCEEKKLDPSGVKEIGPCWLPDHRLKFHYRSFRREGGAADVVPAGCGHAVPGVLFELNDRALANMDRKEGHPNTYQRTMVDVLLPDGHLHQLLVREDLLLARHPVEVGVLRRLLVGVVRLAVEDLAERLLVGADAVGRDELEGAERVRVRVVVGDEFLAEANGVVLLAREVDGLDVLRHEGQISLLLVMAVEVLELNLNLVRLGKLLVVGLRS